MELHVHLQHALATRRHGQGVTAHDAQYNRPRLTHLSRLFGFLMTLDDEEDSPACNVATS
jgi:hypothetical protein